jgi:DNA-binding transcriptional LysR family regulator
VGLTEAGERLRGRVAPAFRDIDDALEDLNSFRDTPTGTLRINAGGPPTEYILLPMATRFLAAYLGVNGEIVAENAFVDIVAGGFDAGVRFGEVLQQDMIAVPLGPPQRSAYVASPDFFRRHRKPETPKDLKNLPCIRFRFPSGRFYEWEFERDGARLSVEVDGQLTLGEPALRSEPRSAASASPSRSRRKLKSMSPKGAWCVSWRTGVLGTPATTSIIRAGVTCRRRSGLSSISPATPSFHAARAKRPRGERRSAREGGVHSLVVEVGRMADPQRQQLVPPQAAPDLDGEGR